MHVAFRFAMDEETMKRRQLVGKVDLTLQKSSLWGGSTRSFP